MKQKDQQRPETRSAQSTSLQEFLGSEDRSFQRLVSIPATPLLEIHREIPRATGLTRGRKSGREARRELRG
jgi:hypothetical protein